MGINPDEARRAKKAAKQQPATLAEVVQLPHNNHDAHRRRRYAQGFLTYHTNIVANTPEGGRHRTLLARARIIGGILWTHDITVEEAVHQLETACHKNGHTNDTPIANIRKTIQDGLQHGNNDPILDFYNNLTDNENDWMGQWATHLDTSHEIHTLHHQMVDTFWNSRPLLRHIYDTAQQARVGPFAYLGATLAHLLANTWHRVCLPPTTGGHTSLNLHFALVGPSGAGKGAASRLINDTWQFDPLPEAPNSDISDLGNLSHKPVHINLGSGEGVTHAYVKHYRGQDHRTNYNALFIVDEIDTLTALAGRKGSTIMSVLRQMYSGERLGFQTADATRGMQIQELQYRAALIAGVQPLRAANLMAGADGGTPQRFLFLPTDDPTAPQTITDKPLLRVQHRMPDFANLLNDDHALKLPPVIIETVQTARYAMLTNQKEASQHAAGHDTLTRIKIAALLAILGDNLQQNLDGQLTTTGMRANINDQDWQLAGQLLTLSICERENIQHQLAEAASTNRRKAAVSRLSDESAAIATIEDKARDRIIELLSKPAPKGGYRRRHLQMGMTSSLRGAWQGQLDAMIAAGEVRQNEGVIWLAESVDDVDDVDASSTK